MKQVDRRKFLKMAGVGAAGAATAASIGPLASLVMSITNGGILRFRAVAGLPKDPLPAYASYVLEGRVNLKTRSGVVTKNLFAGAPEAMSAIAFPGMARAVRVTDVQESNGLVQITGLIDNRSQLQRGESPNVLIAIDQLGGTGWADFLGTKVQLRVH